MPEQSRLTVLFLPHPTSTELFRPWGEDTIQALKDISTVRIFDRGEPLAPQFQNVDVVVDHGGGSGTREMADIAQGHVRLWQILGTGIDHFDLDYWRAKRIPVANCPGVFTAAALAECALMFMLMLCRRYPVAESNLRQGAMYRPAGIELANRTLGLVGFGASARELARRARSAGMRLVGLDARPIPQVEIETFGLFAAYAPSQLDALLEQSDFVSLHLPLDDSTKALIDASRIARMRNGAFLINVARGALVDEEALYQALRNGRLGGAGLDVFAEEPPDLSRPIFALENVIATPHIAGATQEASKGRARCVAENVERLSQGLELLYRVDV